MSAVLIPFPEARIMRPQCETPEQKTRRVVMARCHALRVPLRMAQIQADTACNTVRSGGNPDEAINRAVGRAVKGAFPDGPEAA